MAYRDDISALSPDHHWPLDGVRGASATVNARGNGYTVNDTLTVSGGTSSVASQFNVDSIADVAASGIISGAGTGYAVSDLLVISGGTSSLTARFTVDSIISIAASAIVNVGGSGYVVSDQLTISGGTSTTAAVFNVDTVDGGGAVTGVSLVTAGSYSATPANPASTTGGTGTGATLDVTWTDGIVDTISLERGGLYTVQPSNPASTTGGTGTGCTITVTWTTNVVNTISLTTAGAYSVIPSNPASTTGGTGTGCTLDVVFEFEDIIGTAHATPVGLDLNDIAISEDASDCAKTNGTGDSIDFPSVNTINNSTAERKAVAFWVRLSAIQPPPKALYHDGGKTSSFKFVLAFGNNVMLECANTTFEVQVYGIVLNPNRNYHLCGIFESNVHGDEVRFYIDGVKQLDANPTGAAPGGSLGLTRDQASIGEPVTAGSVEVGGSVVLLNAPVNGSLNHCVMWGDTADAILTDTEVREELFEKGALPSITITTDTEANMQIDLDTYADTIRGDEPLNIRIEDVSGGGDLELTADNITHNVLASCHIQWMGTGTLTWINSNGSNASITSTPNSGTIEIQTPVTVEVTARNASTGNAITGARVLLEADTGGPLAVGTDIISTTTNGSGIASVVFNYTADQPVTGKVRKGSSTIYYKTASIVGSITSSGLSLTAFLVPDE